MTLRAVVDLLLAARQLGALAGAAPRVIGHSGICGAASGGVIGGRARGPAGVLGSRRTHKNPAPTLSAGDQEPTP